MTGVQVGGAGSIRVRMSEAVFCRIEVSSEFAVSAKDCGEILFCCSWVYSFWMVGVMRDTFLANA